jgi:hypothetical protein
MNKNYHHPISVQYEKKKSIRNKAKKIRNILKGKKNYKKRN